MKERHSIMAKITKLRMGGGILAVFALVMLLAGVVGATQTASASDSASTSSTVNISVAQSGNTNGANAELEKVTYSAGENVVLKWTGGKDGDDFVIPTAISYNSATVDVSKLVQISQLQSANTEYKRRMNSDGTMTTFENLQNYVAKTHTLNLGEAFAGTVTVTFSKVAPVYRLYNMLTSEHLFTTQKAEYDKFVELCKNDSDAWIGEGISWLAPKEGSGTAQVYRLYNSGLGAMGHSSHYYTSDVNEKTSLENNSGWTDDGTVNGFLSGGTTAIYTCYNEGLGSAHHYTSSKTEWEGLKQHGWALEEDKNGTNPVKTPEGCFQCSLATSWSFDGNYYKVNHVLDGVNTPATVQYVSGKAGETTKAEAMSIPGYDAPASIEQKTIASDNSTEVEITYTAKKYTISYDTKGHGTAPADQSDISYGQKLTAPSSTPTATGYTFKQWCYDYDCEYPVDWTTATMPATDMKLYAGWTADAGTQVTITFNLGSEAHGATAPDNIKVTSGATATKPTDPVATDGYTFAGWYKESGLENAVNWSDKITSDVTYYAKWTAPEPTPEDKVTISFDSDGGSTTPASQTIDKGSTLTSLPTVTKENYILDGWYDGETKVTENTTFDTSKTLKAKWLETITISFDTNASGESLSRDAIKIGKGRSLTEEQLASPGTRTKWDFDAWYIQGEGVTTQKVTTSTTFSADTTIVASWKAKSDVETVTITLNLGGIGSMDGNINSITVPKGEKASKPPAPYSAAGYTFENWYTDMSRQESDTLYNWDSTVNESFTLYAAWAAYMNIKYDGNASSKAGLTVSGTMEDDVQAKVGAGHKLKANTFTAKDSSGNVYGFKGWATTASATEVEYDDRFDGTFKNINPGSTVTLYAVWTSDKLGDYWLSQAMYSIRGTQAQANGDNYNFPESGVVKTQSEIEADLNTIATQTEGSADYTKLKELYTSYMINDNIHLYTKYEGKSTEPNSDVNDYAEFRIINVGAHKANATDYTSGGESDSSILTFQMTHSLPNTYCINADSTKYGGYATSDIESKMKDNGEIYKLFKESFSKKLMSVTKYTREGFKASGTTSEVSDDMKTSSDKFWIPAYQELAGDVASAYQAHADSYKKEGAQYQFYTSKGVTGTSTIQALNKLAFTRSGGVPTGTPYGYSNSWWTRSSVTYTGGYKVGALMCSDGTLSNSANSQNVKVSIVPCFSVTKTTS
jgi:uncharacterized repeat protein (TIGR02543 family)